jgi:hypothetical protein
MSTPADRDDHTARLQRAEAALTAYDPQSTDTSPAEVITALLDLDHVTGHAGATLSEALVRHAAHLAQHPATQEQAGDRVDQHAMERAEENSFVTVAATIIAALLHEARHMEHVTPEQVQAAADATYAAYLAEDEELNQDPGL